MHKIICVTNDRKSDNSPTFTEHGLSLWIESENGVTLFDTGQSASVLKHNMSVLGLDPYKVKNLVFSHAHYDHTGGLLALKDCLPQVKIFAHEDIFTQRYSLRNGKYSPIGLSDAVKDLVQKSDSLFSTEPKEIMPGLWTSGEILERPEMCGRSNTHFILTENGWQSDPYRDDLSLILHTKQGLVLICGCCHAGLLNSLSHVNRNFAGRIISVIGGTHLMSANEDDLNRVITILKTNYQEMSLFLNHCTGENAIEKLRQTFSSQVTPFYSGEMIVFD